MKIHRDSIKNYGARAKQKWANRQLTGIRPINDFSLEFYFEATLDARV